MLSPDRWDESFKKKDKLQPRGKSVSGPSTMDIRMMQKGNV